MRTMFALHKSALKRSVWTKIKASSFSTSSAAAASLQRASRTLNDDDFDFVDLEDDNDDDSELEPYRLLLGQSARASWRMTPANPPESLAEAQRRVMNETPLSTRKKQTQPALLRLVEHQKALRDRRERERRRIAQNKEYTKEDEQTDNAARAIIYGPEQALASLKHRLYPHYAMTKRVLSESASLVPYFRPKRILDFGTGCGSAAAASWDVFPNSIEWFHLIDASKTMREVSETLLKELATFKDEEQDTNKTADLTLPRITTSAYMSIDADSSFDLCLASFTLTELPDSSSVLASAALMYEKLRPGGDKLM